MMLSNDSVPSINVGKSHSTMRATSSSSSSSDAIPVPDLHSAGGYGSNSEANVHFMCQFTKCFHRKCLIAFCMLFSDDGHRVNASG